MTEESPKSPKWIWERTPTERLVIKVLRDADRPLSRDEIKAEAWTSMRSVEDALRELHNDGRVTKHPAVDTSDCRVRYSLA